VGLICVGGNELFDIDFNDTWHQNHFGVQGASGVANNRFLNIFNTLSIFIVTKTEGNQRVYSTC
jgi:hypothetical protein